MRPEPTQPPTAPAPSAPPPDGIGNSAIAENDEKRRRVLHVGNMPYDITDCEIRKIFRPYMPIHDVIIIKDKSGRPRGFGFVELDAQSAERAMGDLSGTVYRGRPLRVSAARATPVIDNGAA